MCVFQIMLHITVVGRTGQSMVLARLLVNACPNMADFKFSKKYPGCGAAAQPVYKDHSLYAYTVMVCLKTSS